MDSTLKPSQLEEADVIVISSDEEDAPSTINGVSKSEKTSNDIPLLKTETSQPSVINITEAKPKNKSNSEGPGNGSEATQSSTSTQWRKIPPMEHFISVCQPRMKDETEHCILNKLRSLADATEPEFLHSKWFRNLLYSTAEKVSLDSDNIFVYIKDVFDELKMHRKKIKNRHTNLQNGMNVESAVKVDTESTIKEESECAVTTATECSITEVSIMKPSHNGSSSESTKTVFQSEETPSTSHSAHDVSSDSFEPDPCQQRNINKLEQLLQKLHRKIRKIEMMELSLDDLERSDSVYIMEEVYKRRFMRVWRTLCQARKQSTYTGRYCDKKFTFQGSRFPEVNAKIEKFVNRHKQFPDFTDILKIIREASTEVPSLRLGPSHLEAIARDIFVDVGNELQRRRKLDVKESLHCLVLNTGSELHDPADADESLRCKLEEHHKEGSSKLQEIINKYATEQEMLDLKPEVVSDDNEEVDDDDEEEEEEEILDNTSEEDAPVSDDEDKKLNLAAGGETKAVEDAQEESGANDNLDVNEDSPSSSDDESAIMEEGKDVSSPDVEETIVADIKSEESSPLPSVSPISHINIPGHHDYASRIQDSKENLPVTHLNNEEGSIGSSSSTKVPTSLHSPSGSAFAHGKRRWDSDVYSGDKKLKACSPTSDRVTPPLQQIVMDDSGDVEIILLD